MANLTRLQLKDATRLKLSELDSKKIKDELLNLDINFSIRKVQKDLIPIGFKTFTKQAVITAQSSVVPTDLLADPNAIIDLKVSTGTRAIVASGDGGIGTTSEGVISAVVTMVEPGTTGNGWVVTFKAGTALGVTVNPSAKTVLVEWNNEATSVGALQTYMDTHAILQNVMSIALDGGSAALTKTKPETVLTTASGIGTGWKMADEVSIEDYNRATGTYNTPSATNPIFVRRGSSTGSSVIEVLPLSMTYALLYYYYRLADLTADTDSLALPQEFEELVLLDLLAKQYVTLQQTAESQNKMVEYENKVKQLESKYQNALMSVAFDKTRLQSNDNTPK